MHRSHDERVRDDGERLGREWSFFFVGGRRGCGPRHGRISTSVRFTIIVVARMESIQRSGTVTLTAGERVRRCYWKFMERIVSARAPVGQNGESIVALRMRGPKSARARSDAELADRRTTTVVTGAGNACSPTLRDSRADRDSLARRC